MELGGKVAMSETYVQEFFARQAADARGPESERPPRRKRRRRLKRIAIAAGASLAVIVGAVVGGGYLYVNHLASSVHRIPGIAALTAADRPAEPHDSMNVLLTDSGLVPGQATQTGLIEILHLNGSQHRGAVVSIPANAFVSVPGHGPMELGKALGIGGRSRLHLTVAGHTPARLRPPFGGWLGRPAA